MRDGRLTNYVENILRSHPPTRIGKDIVYDIISDKKSIVTNSDSLFIATSFTYTRGREFLLSLSLNRVYRSYIKFTPSIRVDEVKNEYTFIDSSIWTWVNLITRVYYRDDII